MKPDLENLKEYTQKTSLSQEEKFAMLQNIRHYSNTHPIKTPYYHSIFFKHSIAYASMFAVLIGTSATSFAAESALPGDILYPIKTEINEKVAKTLALTDTQKAKVNVKLVDKRMEELTELIVKEQDTPEKIDSIVLQLEEHKGELQEYIEKVEVTDTQASKVAVAIYTELESVVDAHLDILEDIAKDTEITDAVVSIEPTGPIETTSMLIAEETIPAVEVSTSTEILSGEQSAVLEIIDFSEKLEPILTEAKLKSHTDENEATSTKIKEDTRKRIIKKVEEELQIDVEEKDTTQEDIQIDIKNE